MSFSHMFQFGSGMKYSTYLYYITSIIPMHIWKVKENQCFAFYVDGLLKPIEENNKK